MSSVAIGKRLVGPGHPAFIIAEVGINHNGRLDLAIELIERAAAAGVDSVKFQNWVAEDFISDRSQLFTYRSQGRQITEPFYDLCKRYELPKAWLPELAAACTRCGVEFLSTPTTQAGIQELLDLGVRVMKNGSDYLSHIPLIRAMARQADALILSTGMAWAKDVDYAVEAIRSANPACVPIILHCTSMYPTPPEQVNLRRMLALGERYGTMVGYSDHSEGSAAAVQAVTLGAVVLEKHYTLDHDMEGPDHWFSVDPDELAEYVRDVRAAEARLGIADLAPSAGEKPVARDQRLSAVAARALPAGHVLGPDDVDFKKPGTGIHPAEIESWYGRTLGQTVAAEAVLTPELFA